MTLFCLSTMQQFSAVFPQVYCTCSLKQFGIILALLRVFVFNTHANHFENKGVVNLNILYLFSDILTILNVLRIGGFVWSKTRAHYGRMTYVELEAVDRSVMAMSGSNPKLGEVIVSWRTTRD